uniref:Uncharacterized protein n=1 Tax=Rhizophora mucronata TaxID=61149 RepID=A0A2P2IRP8_RHIMU
MIAVRVFTGISVFKPIHVTALCPCPVNFVDISLGSEPDPMVNKCWYNP